MSEYYLTESIERYINNEMLPEEKAYFEQMRVQNPEIDRLIAEHRIFMQTLAAYADNKNFKSQLNLVHNQLSEENKIDTDAAEEPETKIISLWQRYKKTATIAACIAGFTALVISGSVSIFSSPDKNNIQQLGRKIDQLEKAQAIQSSKIKEVTKMPANAVIKSGGTAFLIDGEGYLITNAHVLKGNSAIVANNEGHEFSTGIVYIDKSQDLALLKITDDDYKPTKTIPYGIKSSEENLAARVFTLGYPTDNITYNQGYISAQKGYESDTSTILISLLANPGNSGGPVFDNNGDVIGILSARQTNEQGVTFAIKSKEIFKMLNHWKESEVAASKKVSVSNKNSLKGLDRETKIIKLQEYVYNVKAYN